MKYVHNTQTHTQTHTRTQTITGNRKGLLRKKKKRRIEKNKHEKENKRIINIIHKAKTYSNIKQMTTKA